MSRLRLRSGVVSGIAAVVAVSMLLGACSNHPTTLASPTGTGSGQTTPPVTSPPSTPPPSESPSPATSPSPTASPVIADGRSFGVVKSFDPSVSAPSMVFDLEEFFTGEAANQAARDDGVLGQNETLPNDYYIRNANPRLRTLPVAADVQIVIVDWEHCCGSIPGEIAPFAQGFTVDNHAANYHGSDSPYWLTVEGGVVVKIEEQYLP